MARRAATVPSGGSNKMARSACASRRTRIAASETWAAFSNFRNLASSLIGIVPEVVSQDVKNVVALFERRKRPEGRKLFVGVQDEHNPDGQRVGRPPGGGGLFESPQ